MSATIPGKAKGDPRVPVEQAEDRDLNYWAERIAKDLAADPNSQFAARNQQTLDGINAELERRGMGDGPPKSDRSNAAPAPRAAAPRQAPAATEASSAIQLFSGAHSDASKATAALQKLQEVGHLVSPAPACGTLPAGTSVVISAIMVDTANETFPIVGGKQGLGKVPLHKIAGALGLSWSPESGRIDDGSDPRFVHYRAVGYIRQFDGTLRQIIGEKIMDLRPNSAQVEAHRKRAEDKARRENKQIGDWESQIRDMRLFILEHAETKAQLRAIRSLGLRSSYTADELKKPFFAAKLQFTGQSDDPQVRFMFAQRIADSMLGSTALLYGKPPQPLPRQQTGYAPPYMDTHGAPLNQEDGAGVDDDDFQT